MRSAYGKPDVSKDNDLDTKSFEIHKSTIIY